MDIRLKRVYDEPAKTDGCRVLVDRIWPRGLKKEALRLDEWLKDIAPSTPLRKWFGHEPGKWAEFQERYFAELDESPGPVQHLRELASKRRLTLLFAAHYEQHNNAVALKTYLERSRGARG